MTAAATKPFTAVCHELADIEKINGKVFTMNMVYTYALIEGYQNNGQTAYFSQEMLKRRLGVSRQTVVKLLADMAAMGLINKTAQIGGKTCHYTVNPITPEMVGAVEATPEALPEQLTDAPEAPEVKPIPAAPGEQPTDLIRLYTSKVETAEQQTGQAVPIAPAVTLYPRGEIKEPSRDWDLDPAF
ncbi:MarR family transcriptional regulator [Klebsiella aerogenes]|uniref:MarR family transcriptional regulator n=1 Tax=Klebsiella aerogenes TaxID=548 RepID=UPI003D35FF66